MYLLVTHAVAVLSIYLSSLFAQSSDTSSHPKIRRPGHARRRPSKSLNSFTIMAIKFYNTLPEDDRLAENWKFNQVVSARLLSGPLDSLKVLWRTRGREAPVTCDVYHKERQANQFDLVYLVIR